MGFTVDAVIDQLELEGVRLDRGLTEADLRRLEKRYGWTFGPDQRALLRIALPSGDAWLNWRHATPAKVQERLQPPAQAATQAVERGFWPEAWGSRPADGSAALDRLNQAPSLIPLYGDCYLPGEPAPSGSPVFRVRDGRVTSTGLNLLDWATTEIGAGAASGDPNDTVVVEFWSELAERA